MRRNTIPTLLVACVLACAARSVTAARVIAVGDPVDGPIISAYAPKTRAEEPVVATAAKVFEWNATRQSWVELYRPPWKDAVLHNVTGYARSSKVLYVAHSAGIARSGDGGQTWVEALPAGYRQRASAGVRLQVNPGQREHAVALADGMAWETTDFGQSWQRLLGSGGSAEGSVGSAEGAVGMTFVSTPGEGMATALLATRSGLHLLEGMPLVGSASWLAPYTLVHFEGHPREACAWIADAKGQVAVLSWSTENTLAYSSPPIPALEEISHWLGSGNSAAWSAVGNEVCISGIRQRGDRYRVATFPGPVLALEPHPDQPDVVYCGVGNQLYRVEESFADLPSEVIELALARPTPTDTEWIATSGVASVGPAAIAAPAVNADLSRQLQALVQAQPAFSDVLEAAIAHAEGRPADFAKWEAIARKRNWLPELRLEAGVRERNTDNNFLYEPVDAYGIPGKPEDLNLPDRIQPLGFAAVVLQWDLHELLFDAEQVDIRRERRYTFEERRKLTVDLSRIYHGRLQKLARLNGLFGEITAEEFLKLSLEIRELTEILNGFCGSTYF